MNKQQKEILQTQLDSEKKTINELKQVYNQALKDVNEKISLLSARADMNPPELQSIIYQKQYQQAIKGQLEGIMTNLQSNEYATISDYLTRCYQDGYVGTMYDLQGQGIPLVIPIDQKQVTKAIQMDSKLSKNLYTRLGEDVNSLKKSVRAEISRGIANGSSWLDMAEKISKSMKNTPFEKSINNSIRIARTEGHRIQNAATLDAQHKAKEKGANIVKQWDSTLDGATRDTHRQLDGQIREIDEDFEVNGLRASAPGMFGDPAEDCNCRCAILQRARWALDESELEILKERAEYFGLDKTEDFEGFEDFKSKYLKLPDNADTMKIENHELTESTKNVIDLLQKEGVEYRKVELHSEFMTEEQIIKVLGGGDRTSGSCSSLAMSYLGQKKGLNVLDFRGGKSMEFFASKANKKLFFSQFTDIYHSVMAKNTAKAGTEALKLVESGKEYLLGVGSHMAVVRRTDAGVLQYLELQSVHNNGWHDFTSNPRQTLIDRFGCSGKGWRGLEVYEAQLTNIDDFDSVDDLKEVLGYINTASNEQKKGVGGHER